MGISSALNSPDWFSFQTMPQYLARASLLLKHLMVPSSVFETILVVDDGKTDENVLKLMVEEINGEWKEKAPEEWLSDSVYYYDKENDEIKIAA